MLNARIILTTVGQRDAADKLAGELVERRLAACVNIVGPLRSIYRWKGQVQNDEEFLLLIKTTAQGAAQVRAALGELHPYELPECIELNVDDGSEAYLQWIAAEVSSSE